MRHSGNKKTELAVGDMVVKEKQVNIARKGGRLDTKREAKYYGIAKFLSNGCIVLRDLEMDLIDPVPIPASHIKKVIQKYDSDGDKSDDNDNMAQNEPKKRWNTNDNTNTTATGKSMETTIDNTDIRMSGSHFTTNSIGPNTVSSTDTNTNTTPTKINDDSGDEGYDPNVIFTSDEDDNIFDDIVDDNTMGYYDRNDELQIVGETTSTFTFQPLSWSSREEVGPLVQITKFNDIEFKGIGDELRGMPTLRERMISDGNCYFRAISFAISGSQDYHEVHKCICDYIEYFPGRLTAVLTNAHDVHNGKKYLQKSEMHKSNIWGTKIEILATAKCFKHDIFTYYNYKWQRYSYLKTLSSDAIYLDNRAGNHFDVVIMP